MTKLSNIYIQNLTKKATAYTSNSVYIPRLSNKLESVSVYRNIDKWKYIRLQKEENYRRKPKDTSKFHGKKWVEKIQIYPGQQRPIQGKAKREIHSET